MATGNLTVKRRKPTKEDKILNAARNGDVELIRSSISSGIDVARIRDWYQQTPLHFAAREGHTETVAVLLKSGADVNTKDWYQQTPLHFAAREGHTETVAVLLKSGADVNTKDESQETPLHGAARGGHTETVAVLLKSGADVNTKDWSQETPLHFAARGGHTETVAVLLKSGADVNTKDWKNQTAIELARERHHSKTVDCLIKHLMMMDNHGAIPKTGGIPGQQLYMQQQLPLPYYQPAQMFPQLGPYQQQLLRPQYLPAAQQIMPAYTGTAASMPPTTIHSDTTILKNAPHKPSNQTITKQSRAIKIVNPQTMKEVDTSNLKTSSSAHLMPEALKQIEQKLGQSVGEDISFNKESTIDKGEDATESVEKLKNNYEKKLSAKEVEINQLNDTVTELELKQRDLITANKILKRQNEQLRESSKKDMDNQAKLEAEIKKLKLENEELKKATKLEDPAHINSSDVTISSKVLKHGSYYVCSEAQYLEKKYVAKKELIKNKISKKLLKREHKFVIHLDHPCIVQQLAMLDDTRSPVLLMERMLMSLTEFLATKHSHHNKISILRDTACGLHYIHEKGIIHCDLTADSIVLTDNVTAKLSDFGRATFYQENMDRRLPKNCDHVPPEILESYSKTNCSTKVDVFSFGCVAIHTFTQEQPVADFDKFTETSVGRYIKHSEIVRRSVCLEKLKNNSKSTQIHDITLQCLQDNPEDRPTASFLLSFLEKLKTIVPNYFKYEEDVCTELSLKSYRCRATIPMLLIQHLTLLTTLNVSGCHITDQGAEMIAAVLVETISLAKLDLSNTVLNSFKAAKICDASNSITSLKILNLSNNNIDNGAAKSIAAVISNNNFIEEMNLSHNKLSYTGVLNITNALSGNIRVVDISSNMITSDSIVELATVLSKCPVLQRLNVSHNLLTLTNILILTQAFRRHPTLKSLNLSNNTNIFSSACEFIVDVILSVNKTLVDLNVCGRNIRPRYVKDNLSPPSGINHLTTFMLQNLYLMLHFPLGIQTSLIKVIETCPIASEDIISYYVDHLGGVFYNQFHNFVMLIPPGAVSQGHCVEIQAAANYYGPIPVGFYPISSYFWVSANYEFKSPVYLVMNHYAKIRSLEDINNLHVLHKCVRDPNIVSNDLMTKIPDGVYFDIEIGYCVLAINHFCSYCLAKDVKHIPDYLLACYCTFDEYSDGDKSLIAEVCFCPSNSECKKVVEEQCTMRNTKLKRSVMFAITDGDELYISSIDASKLKSNEWILDEWGRLTITHLCDFKYWEMFRGLTNDQIKEREKSFEYPPRLQIKCEQIDYSKLLHFSFKVAKRTKNREIAIAQFSLCEKISGVNPQPPIIASENKKAAIALSAATTHDVLDTKPEMWDIISIVIPKIKAKWDYVAYSMKYSITAVNAFEKDSTDSEQSCLKVFKDWLSTPNGITPKTWLTLLDRIKAVDGLQAEAEDIERKAMAKLAS